MTTQKILENRIAKKGDFKKNYNKNIMRSSTRGKKTTVECYFFLFFDLDLQKKKELNKNDAFFFSEFLFLTIGGNR